MHIEVISQAIKILKFSIGWKVSKASFNVQLKTIKKSIICVNRKKMMDPITSAKTYWLILKTFLNNKKCLLSPALSLR